VEYSGISFGLQDMGRDLICKKDAQIKIVQCKCWSAHKTIHEKHINQLYGTTVKYYIDTIKRKSVKKLAEFPDLIKSEKIKAVFVTATNLSETAWDFANALGIQVRENEKLQDYPMIKCNINAKHEKIYHLPFDQQYDKTQIDKPGEFYAYSVKEAESQGFRRAYRWKGLIHSGNPM
ncbi:MAG: restriction endonuclease, partial [Syntrophorhabdus sp.]